MNTCYICGKGGDDLVGVCPSVKTPNPDGTINHSIGDPDKWVHIPCLFEGIGVKPGEEVE